ncbi:MAG: hypothetical protein M5U19_06765 [Microthrixaceae bacterium]|nr:hypothetical protein [Microthrixaceae bacterium]
MATTTHANPAVHGFIGQNSRSPASVVGAVGERSATSATDQATSNQPAAIMIHRGATRDAVSSAAPSAHAVATTPKDAPAATNSVVPPGRRCDISEPVRAMTAAPVKMPYPSTPEVGRRRVAPRSAGDSRRWCTSAASSASGPPREPDRIAASSKAANARPAQAGPWSDTFTAVCSETAWSPTAPETMITTTSTKNAVV